MEKGWSEIRSFVFVPLTCGGYSHGGFSVSYFVSCKTTKASEILQVSLCSRQSNTKQNFQCQGCSGREKGGSREGKGAVLRKLLRSGARGPPPGHAWPLSSPGSRPRAFKRREAIANNINIPARSLSILSAFHLGSRPQDANTEREHRGSWTQATVAERDFLTDV